MTSRLEQLLRPGELIVAGQVLGEPVALLDELFGLPQRPPGLTLFAGMTLTDTLRRAPSDIDLVSFVGLGVNTELIAAGRMNLVPCQMSTLPGLMSDGPLRPGVAMVVASPPDGDGNCHLGVQADYLCAAVSAARVVVAEINEHVPRVGGDTVVPFGRLDGHVRTDRPLPGYERPEPSPVEAAIAARVAPNVTDGTCVQIGVGRLGEAVLRAVGDRRHLGVHTGMVGDTILEMMRDGVVTNARKGLDRNLTVAGSILGSAAAVALADGNPGLRLRSVAYTNDEAVIGQLGPFVSVNAAVEVDVLGQVNTEVAGDRYVGGIGGSVDFMRAAAHSPDGRSIVTVNATARGGQVSRIVPQVQRVTALRSDVDMVVTEHGIAELRGVSEGERARRLIAVAAPEHRQRLLLAAKELGL